MDAGSTPDAGVRDSGAGGTDATVMPPRDGGVRDSGPPADGGHYCTMNGEVDVNGTAVAVADVSGRPTTASGATAVTSCIDNPPSDNPPFINELCFTECLDFLGESPTAADVSALDLDIFFAEMNGNPVDPTYDYGTRRDRMPNGNTGAGFRITENASDCDSGFQIEIGYGSSGQVLAAETQYIIRVRSATSAVDWPTVYMHNFIRRNDEVPQVSVCGNDEQRIPSRAYEFPVVSSALLSSAVSQAGNVVGAADLTDGLGSGHAIIETLDCTGGGGVPSAGISAGFNPAPAGAYFLDANYGLDTAATETSEAGLYLGVGFPGNTETSSMSVDITGAVGLTTTGACTEEFGGLVFPVYSDGVTYIRMNRETVIHGR